MTAHGVVMEGTGGVWRVHMSSGETLDAILRGRLKQGEGTKLAVGDHVTIERDERDSGAWAIAEIHERKSKLERRAPGQRAEGRVVIANVDQVVVVFAFVKPEPHARMIDRFLVIAEANGISARLVMNKCELTDDASARAFAAPYERAGYAVHYTSVKAAIGLDALRDALSARVTSLAGPSGVGKSSLLNAMYPGSELRVGDISESVNKGRHTTVGARLMPLPVEGGGYVADTPGLREVGLWGIAATDVAACFREFRPFLDECRFQDCAHDREPACAVLAAVERGDIPPERHASYLKLRAELSTGTETWRVR
ncbi:MAG TPA: ribosome small subunit-dependent GTPase A [Gemmatimonadaceae bacterium]|nr:ribosome small subunit-dependent GTPase A [Gemmatimonadaceae bacterium]